MPSGELVSMMASTLSPPKILPYRRIESATGRTQMEMTSMQPTNRKITDNGDHHQPLETALHAEDMLHQSKRPVVF